MVNGINWSALVWHDSEAELMIYPTEYRRPQPNWSGPGIPPRRLVLASTPNTDFCAENLKR
jgi:hypothetical protein